jgi:hypothetical protein
MRITIALVFAGLMAFLGAPSHAQSIGNYQHFDVSVRKMLFVDAYDNVLTTRGPQTLSPIFGACAQKYSVENLFVKVDGYIMQYNVDVNEPVRDKLYHAVMGVCMQH